MKLPGGERAFVDLKKLRDYCLSPNHPEGKHKARVFQAALNLGVEDAEWLLDALMEATKTEAVKAGRKTLHGERYLLDFQVSRHGKRAMLRSVWIVRANEQFPRLVSCYVL